MRRKQSDSSDMGDYNATQAWSPASPRKEEKNYTPSDSGLELTCCGDCSRKSLYWSNVTLAVLGLSLMIASVAGYLSSTSYGLSELVLILIMLASLFVLVYASIGLCAGKTDSSWPLYLYMFSLILAVLLQCVIISLMFSPSYAKSSLKHSYRGLSDDKRDELEKDLDCCSFDSADTTERCQATGVTDDCYDEMDKRLQRWTIPIVSMISLLMIGEITLFVFSLVTHLGLKDAQKRQTMNPSSKGRSSRAASNL